MQYCLNCGMNLEDDDRFCVRCGMPVQADQSPSPDGKKHMEARAGKKKQGSLAAQETDSGSERPGAPVKAGSSESGSAAKKESTNREGAAAAGSGREAGKDGEKKSAGRRPAKRAGMGYRATDREEEENGQRRTVLLLFLVCLVFAGVLAVLLLHPGRSGSGQGQESADAVPGESADNSVAEASDPQSSPDNAAAEGPGPAVEVSEADEAGPTEEEIRQQEEEARRAAEEQAASEREAAEREAAERAAEEKRIAEEKAAAEKAAEEKRIAEEQAAAKKAEEEKKAAEEAAALARNRPEATDGSYLLPDSSSRNYSYEEVSRLDDYTLQMAINEIYARHGRKFDTPSIQEYFNKKSWYNGTIDPKDFDGNESAYFNSYEMANRELMAKVRDGRAAAAQGSTPASANGGQGQ